MQQTSQFAALIRDHMLTNPMLPFHRSTIKTIFRNCSTLWFLNPVTTQQWITGKPGKLSAADVISGTRTRAKFTTEENS